MKKNTLSCSLLLLLVSGCSFFDETFDTETASSQPDFKTNEGEEKETPTPTPTPATPTQNPEDNKPETDSTTKKKYKVKFYNYDNTVLQDLTVEEGKIPEVNISDPDRPNEYDPDKNADYEFKYTFVTWTDDNNKGYQLNNLPKIYKDTNFKPKYNGTQVGKYLNLYLLDDYYKTTGELKYGPCGNNTTDFNPRMFVSTVEKSARSKVDTMLKEPSYFVSTNTKDGVTYEFCGWSRSKEGKPTDTDLIPQTTVRSWTYKDFNDEDTFYGVFKQK